MEVKEIKEALFTKREVFILFPDGTISCHKGHFEEDPDHRYIHDVYPYPDKKMHIGFRFSDDENSDTVWHRERRNIEEMNAIAKVEQRKEYYKKIKLIRKQWKAQNPSAFARVIDRMMARVRD